MKGLYRSLGSRLRNKITLPFAVLTLLVALAGTLLTVRLTSGSLEERLRSYVADSLTVATDGMKAHQDKRLAALRAMLYTEGVVEALEKRDTDQLTRLLVPLKMNYRVDAVEVVDSSAREVLGIHHQPGSARVDEFRLSQEQQGVLSWPIVQRTLAGKADQLGDKQAEIVGGPSGSVLWIGGPVVEEGKVVGAVLVGTYLDNLAQELAAEAAARVSIYDPQGRLLASTLFEGSGSPALPADVLSDLIGASNSAPLIPLSRGGREYLAGYAPLMLRGETVGIISAAVSTEYIGQANEDARATMVMLFSIVGLAVLSLGHFIAGRIAAPIRSLVAVSRRVASYDFSQRVEQIGDDEIGELSSTFNFMTDELQRYTEQLSQRIADLTLLFETSTNLNRTQDVNEILDVAVDAIHRSGQADMVVLLVRDRIEKNWFYAGAKGLPPAQVGMLLTRTMERLPGSFPSSFDEGKPVVVDQESRVRAMLDEIGVDMPIGSIMLIPLTSSDEMMGLIVLGKTAESRFSDADQLALLRTISTEIAWSIHRAQLYTQVTEQVHQLVTLQQASRSISAKLSKQEVLEQILDNVIEISRGELAAISIWDVNEVRLRLGAWKGICRNGQDGEWPGQRMAEAAVMTGQAVTTRGKTIVEVPAGDENLDLGDSLCVSIRAEGQVLGTVFVRLPFLSGAFLHGDLMVLNTVANQAGVALKNALLYEDIQLLYHNVVKSLAAAIDARDPYTHGHSHRVAANCALMAEALGLGKAEREIIEVAAYLHDVGKIGVRDEVLLKRGRLSEQEMRLIREHPAVGARILEPVGFDREVIAIVLSHHERLDGAGYPNGLVGEAIPFGGRILCVADSFDAMISSRPYRTGLPVETAIAELRAHSGTQFDPDMVETLVGLLADGRVVLPSGALLRQQTPGLAVPILN